MIFLLGLSGRAGSGKNFAVNYFLAKYPRSRCLSFAAPIKQFAIDYFGLSPDDVYGDQKTKNETLTKYFWEDLPYYTKVHQRYYDKATDLAFSETLKGEYSYDVLNTLRAKYLAELLPKGQMTVRELLEQIGEEMLLPIYPDIWLDKFRQEFLKTCDELRDGLILVDDIRKPEQVREVQRLGGKVVRLLRDPFKRDSLSETALDSFRGFDRVIDNRELSVDDYKMKIQEIEEDYL